MSAFIQVQASASWPSASQLWIAGTVTALFAVLARAVRGVSRSGALAGAVVCFLLYAGAGRGAFLALVSVFALTWISTRFGYRRKVKLGTAETNHGRTASQVLANVAIAGICAGLSPFFAAKTALWLAASAALSEAAGDTVSSEVGQVFSQQPRLITTWEQVPAGTDGAISGIGALSGVLAATLVSIVCALGGLVKPRQIPLSVLAAILGITADSLLGALLERRSMLNNDAVNFISTATAATAAFLLVRAV